MTDTSPLVHRLRVERERLLWPRSAVSPLIGMVSMLLIVGALSLLLSDAAALERVASALAARR